MNIEKKESTNYQDKKEDLDFIANSNNDKTVKNYLREKRIIQLISELSGHFFSSLKQQSKGGISAINVALNRIDEIKETNTLDEKDIDYLFSHSDLRHCDLNRRTPLMLAILKCEYLTLKQIEYIISKSNIMVVDYKNCTPFVIAIEKIGKQNSILEYNDIKALYNKKVGELLPKCSKYVSYNTFESAKNIIEKIRLESNIKIKKEIIVNRDIKIYKI